MEKPCYAEKPWIKEINPETLRHPCFTVIGGKREGIFLACLEISKLMGMGVTECNTLSD